MLTIKTLENTSIADLTRTFNLAFSDYSMPIAFKPEQFETKFETEGGRLDLSVGAFEGDRLVAFIMHFKNERGGKDYIYNGGTGVIPAHRGNQLTSKLYDYIHPLLKKEKIDQLILEVFTDNTSALKIYKNRGFKIMREVLCYRGKLIQVEAQTLDNAYHLTELQDLDWKHLQSFWDYTPTWQNSSATLNNLKDHNLHLGIEKEGKIIGYLIYNTKAKRIYQMAVDKNHRNQGIGSTLLQRIFTLEKGDISFINIDSRTSHMKAFLERRGLKNNVNQYEMEVKLDDLSI